MWLKHLCSNQACDTLLCAAAPVLPHICVTVHALPGTAPRWFAADVLPTCVKPHAVLQRGCCSTPHPCPSLLDKRLAWTADIDMAGCAAHVERLGRLVEVQHAVGGALHQGHKLLREQAERAVIPAAACARRKGASSSWSRVPVCKGSSSALWTQQQANRHRATSEARCRYDRDACGAASILSGGQRVAPGRAHPSRYPGLASRET